MWDRNCWPRLKAQLILLWHWIFIFIFSSRTVCKCTPGSCWTNIRNKAHHKNSDPLRIYLLVVSPWFSRTSLQSMRSGTSRVQLKIQRICRRLPTSPKTSSPVTTTATSSLLLTWSVPTNHLTLITLLDPTPVLRVLIFFAQNLAYEIILTLGQAFEVAYQLALQARKTGHGSSTLPESFDSKPSKPVPKPRINIRKSVSSTDTPTWVNVLFRWIFKAYPVIYF